PVYHEFIGKFGELLHIDPTGAVIFKVRLAWGRSSLQPVAIPITEKTGICLMRYSGLHPRRILSLGTTDGGVTWTSPQKTELPNPNAAVSGLLLDNGGLLLVFNNSEDNRKDLSLAYSDDQGKNWRIIHAFEKETAFSEDHLFSYPCLIRDGKGIFHLFYTWHKRRI
ncbi:MAG: hypothetical protein GY846_06545, partial [Deltaproteobacteria bacterium]|nr:hypothetical protein [Deltaproteobacteria bacterium]